MDYEQKTILDCFEYGITEIRSAFQEVPAGILDKAPAPGKWSIRQIMVHVADTEIVAAMRIRQIAAEPGALLIGYDQDKWANAMSYSGQSAELALEIFVILRQSTTAMLRLLLVPTWANVGNHEERGLTSLGAFVGHMANHAELHAAQIRKIREQFGHPVQG